MYMWYICPRCRRSFSSSRDQTQDKLKILDTSNRYQLFIQYRRFTDHLQRYMYYLLFEKEFYLYLKVLFFVFVLPYYVLPANGCLQQTFMHQNGVYPVLHSQRQIHVCYTSNNILDCCSSSTTTTTTTTTSRAVYVKTIFHRLGS